MVTRSTKLLRHLDKKGRHVLLGGPRSGSGSIPCWNARITAAVPRRPVEKKIYIIKKQKKTNIIIIYIEPVEKNIYKYEEKINNSHADQVQL